MQFWNLLIFFSSLACILTYSCQNESNPEETCKYGKPVAIFQDTFPGILSHHFEAQGQEAREKVVFDKGWQVEILQSGCNAIRQEFRFELPAPGEGEPNWFLVAADLFSGLSGLDPSLAPLAMWATTISSKAGVLKLGEPSLLEENFFVKIDKLPAADSVMLIVILSEGEP